MSGARYSFCAVRGEARDTDWAYALLMTRYAA